MQKVFCFGSHTLALTVPQGAVVTSMDEDEMLKVIHLGQIQPVHPSGLTRWWMCRGALSLQRRDRPH
jgi:hypothetical protein